MLGGDKGLTFFCVCVWVKEDGIWKRIEPGAEVEGLTFVDRKYASLGRKKEKSSHLMGFLYSVNHSN